MSALKFIEQLEQQGLLEEKVVAKLRKSVTDSAREVSARDVAKTLIKKGHLTKFQAKKLLEDSGDGDAPQSESDEKGGERPVKAAPNLAKEKPVSSAPAPQSADNNDLDLVADETEEDEVMDLSGFEADDEAPAPQVPMQPPAGGLSPLDDGGLTPLDSGGLTPLDAGDGLTPMGGAQGGVHGGMAGDPFADPFADPYGQAPQAEPQPEEPKSKGKQKKKPRESQWESPLLFAGGALLLMLIIGLGFLAYNLLRQGEEALWAKANEEYDAESYTSAIERYEEFLANFPDSENATNARVRKGMADLRLKIKSGKRNMTPALQAARDVIPKIAIEDGFSSAHEELIGAIPQMATGFLNLAEAEEKTADAEKLVNNAEEGMKLLEKHVPGSVRTLHKASLDPVLKRIADERAKIDREKDLVATLGKIKEAVSKDQTDAAYQLRFDLIDRHEILRGNPRLADAVKEIAGKERDLVKFVPDPRDGLPPEDDNLLLSQYVLTSRRGDGAAEYAGRALLFLVNGAVYGLDAGTGDVLWRRFVGFDTEHPPLLIDKNPGGDAIMSDARTFEVLRVKSLTGEVVWRQTMNEPFMAPVVATGRVYVSTESGKVHALNMDDGSIEGYIQLTQGVQSPPFADDSRRVLYQVGEHSNVYAISTDSMECREVFYLDHEAGSVRTQPFVLRDFLFIPENAEDYCVLHVLETDAATGVNFKPRKVEKEHERLSGRVIVPMQQRDSKLYVLTDFGKVYVFDIDTQAVSAPPAKVVLESGQPHSKPTQGYFAVGEGRLWRGDTSLSLFDVQLSTGAFPAPSSTFRGHSFVAPIQNVGDLFYTVRRQPGSPGFSIAANRNVNEYPLWETNIAAPLAGPPRWSEKKSAFVAASADGMLFQVPGDTPVGNHNVVAPVPVEGVARVAFTSNVQFPDGAVAFTSSQQANVIRMFDPASNSDQLKQIAFPVDKEEVTAPPFAFHGGVAVPSGGGRVFLLDHSTGQQLAQPFQPPKGADGPAGEVNWSRAALSEDAATMFISDNRQQLFRVGFSSGGRPAYALDTQAKLTFTPGDSVGIAGDTLYLTSRGEAADAVVPIAIADLAEAEKLPLQGRVTWGPQESGGVVFLQTSQGHIHCFEAGAKERWSAAQAFEPLAGTPLADGADYIFASIHGKVWRLNGQTGEMQSAHEFDQPLAHGPLACNAGLLLTGADGVVHVLPALKAN